MYKRSVRPPPTRRRRSKNFVAIPFNFQMGLATLADGTVILQAMLASTFGEDIYLVSLDWGASIRDLTAGETPISFGLAHGDLSLTEVAEALDAEVTNPDDIIAKERARRPVRRLGVFGESLLTGMTVNDGILKRSKILFSVGNGFDLNWWARNQSGGTLTTGAIIEVNGTLYGRWQR